MEGNSKGHESSSDANDRESRVQARRQRIEARNASIDDETRKKKQQVAESKKMSRGQQQIADSLNQLDRRKLAGIQHVTSIRVQADDTENRRRVEEEERRHKRVEKLQQEAIDSGAKNAAVEMRWSDLFDYSMPQELHRALGAQNQSCTEILASKDALIREFQNQLKGKDEEYVTSLKVQSEDVEKLIERMGQQYREMQEEYEMELDQMEEAFLKERDELIATNKLEIDSLFEKRREMEMIYMEAKQARDEQYLKEIEDLRVRDAEDYNELKIKLETNIQTLEQQLEEMRATYQLNTEKLEYNYRVLTERDMENSATLSQQKRKLARLKDALSNLIAKYNQTDTRDRHQNQELTEEYRRITKQYKDLQKKYAHFEASDTAKFDEVWRMHEQEAIEKLEKLLSADKIIHEQQLGLTWKAPAQSIRNWNHDGRAKKKNELSGATRADGSEHSDSATQPHSHSHSHGADSASASSEGFGDAEAPPERKISSAKLKHMLKMLAGEAGFLVNGNVQQALENLPDDEAELVKADMILRALGVDNEEDMERLLGCFFQDPRADVPIEYGNSSGKDGAPQLAPTTKWGLLVQPEDVIRVIKQFVDEMNAQKRVAPMTRLLRRASAAAVHGDGDDKKGGGNGNGGNNAAAIKAKVRKADKEYWDAVVKVLPPRTIRVMTALEKGLTMYNQVLLRRKELIDDVDALRQQNAELKGLLKQYLAAPINEDLIVPPTQMQMYQSRHVYAGGLTWPYFSDMGREPPAYYVFCVGLWCVAVSLFLTWYFNRQYQNSVLTKSIQLGHTSPVIRRLSFFCCALGMLSVIGLPVLAICSTTEYPSVHSNAAYFFFLLETVAVLINTFISFKIYRAAQQHNDSTVFVSVDDVEGGPAVRKNLRLPSVRRTFRIQAVCTFVFVIGFLIYFPIGLSIIKPFKHLTIDECLERNLGTHYCTVDVRLNSTATKLWNYEDDLASTQMRAGGQLTCVLTLVGYSISFLSHDYDSEDQADDRTTATTT
ncbi:TPA: hypothetical protein N0F65_009645 [Lagenidium giganteum]|uniref:Dynein regulatory complex protein 1 n=1 Tax=Lagenidium giganteum TaxID=4803 RepID=A0AAV2YLZ8_9STRA|nr:TPA: hypothetical protein N0F65_009645 [Lagenidium giganteum]